MSQPMPAVEYKITYAELNVYLNSLEKKALTYRINKNSKDPEEKAYAEKMLKQIDQMALSAIERYHNQ